MGFIREPKGVDFVIQSKPLTEKQEKELSEFIAKRKLEIEKILKKSTYTQHIV
jgi:dsDNA-binding SOS-regulon protein